MNNKIPDAAIPEAGCDEAKTRNKKDFWRGVGLGILTLLALYIDSSVLETYVGIYLFIIYLLWIVYYAVMKDRYPMLIGGCAAPLLLIVAMMITGPLIGNKFCTLLGSVYNTKIEVNIIGLPPVSPYQVDIALPSGEIVMSQSCGDATEPNGFLCKPLGAYLYTERQGFTPEEITVFVTINGKKISQVFYPAYTETYINGEGCEPITYESIITMDLNTPPAHPPNWWDKNKMTVIYVSVAVLFLAATAVFLVRRRYSLARDNGRIIP